MYIKQNKKILEYFKNINNSTLFSYCDENMIKRFDSTDIRVVNKDTLDCAIELKDQGCNPVLHNMCNPMKRGGYFETVGSQEEDLIRRGNYISFLNSIEYPLD